MPDALGTTSLFQQPNPALPQDIVAAQRQQMQRQFLAQALMSQAQQPESGMEGWNQMKLVPRMSPLQPLSKAFQSALAGRALKSAVGGSADLQSQIYNFQQAGLGDLANQLSGAGGGPTPAGAPTPTSPSGMPIGQASAGSTPQPGPWAQAPAYTPPSSTDLGKPGTIPQGYDYTPRSFAHAVLLINKMVEAGALDKEVAKSWLGELAPSPEVKKAVAAGLNPAPVLRAQIQQGLTTGYRAGETIHDFGTGENTLAADPSLGVSYVSDGRGGFRAVRIQGQAEEQARRAGLEQAKRSANTIGSWETGPGGTHIGYPADVGGPGLPPALRAPAAPTAAGGAVAPSTPQPPSGGMGGGQQDNHYKMWQPSNIPQRSALFSNTLGKDPVQAGVAQGMATKLGELQTKFGDAANIANQKLLYNAQALQQLPNAEAGPMSEQLTHYRAILQELGLPNFLGKGDTVVPTQIMVKNLVTAALQGAKLVYGPRLTATEVMLQKNQASPSAAMLPLAIKSLIEQDNIRNHYAIDQAAALPKHFAGGGIPGDFEGWYAKNMPLVQYAAEKQTNPAAVDRLRANLNVPGAAAEFKKKLGWLPDWAE
jgi:hypothetical protein